MELNKLIEDGKIPKKLSSNKSIHEYRNRQINWWLQNLNGSEHPNNRNKDYVKFIERIKKNTNLNILNIKKDKKIGEVCGGAWGGLINIYFKDNDKYQIDLLSDFFQRLNVIKDQKTKWICCPAEHILLEDNFFDVLFAYNSLDHGWNIEKALNECIRVSKSGFLSFHVDNDLILKGYPNRDHYQRVRKDKVLSQLYKTSCIKKWWFKSLDNGKNGLLWNKNCRKCGLLIEIYYKK